MSASADRRMIRFLDRVVQERANRARTTKRSSLSTTGRRTFGALKEPENTGSQAEIAEMELVFPFPDVVSGSVRVSAAVEVYDARVDNVVETDVLFTNLTPKDEPPDQPPTKVPDREFTVTTKGRLVVRMKRGVDYLGAVTTDGQETEDWSGLRLARGKSKLAKEDDDDIRGLFGGLTGSQSDGTITG